MNAIETVGIGKCFRGWFSGREVHAVNDVSLTVEKGSTFGLLGPNGAGKTTFVKMLLSAVHPTTGLARLFGQDARSPEARRDVGYLPENHRFPTYMTGRGMLDFYGALSGMDSQTRQRRIPEMLEKVGLDRWGDTRLGKYSKGMLQRIGLAQALLHEPRLLILDEPSDGVDPVGRRQIREILQALEERGVTIFVNSHLLAEVEAFCRDVAILHKGRIVLQGKVRELTAGKGYRLSVGAALPEGLRERLASLSGGVREEDGRLELQFAERTAANAAIDALRSEQIEIDALTPTTSTLEDVFIRSVNG